MKKLSLKKVESSDMSHDFTPSLWKEQDEETSKMSLLENPDNRRSGGVIVKSSMKRKVPKNKSSK